ncbi:MAG: hypothetical protein IKT27_06485 [Clostridia bacterium]|nr:hypothetical protein [Clostridia bacterium]
MIDFEMLASLMEKQIHDFEKTNGDLVDFWQKHLKEQLHNMILEESFLSPDLKGLEDYEKLLTDGN